MIVNEAGYRKYAVAVFSRSIQSQSQSQFVFTG